MTGGGVGVILRRPGRQQRFPLTFAPNSRADVNGGELDGY